MVSEEDIMRLLTAIIPILLIFTLLIFFINSTVTFDMTVVEKWFELMENPIIPIEVEEQYANFGDHWLLNFLEIPVNAFAWLGYFLGKIVASIINTAWAITSIFLYGGS